MCVSVLVWTCVLWVVTDYADGFWGCSHGFYKRYVTNKLLEICHLRDGPAREAHMVPVQRSTLCKNGSDSIFCVFNFDLSWQTLVGMRCRARFRAGLLLLGHRRGRRSQA